MYQPLVSIVTVSYGSSRLIHSLWESLQNCLKDVDFEFIVVDNASPHDDANNLNFLEPDPRAHVVRLAENLGFGGGNAEGVQFAQGKFLALINPDIVLKSDCLEQLIETLQKDTQVGITVPQLENEDGTLQQNTRKFPTIWELIRRRTFGGKDFVPLSAEIQPVDWAQGSFLVMRTDFFKSDLQGFDPRFFLFLEDTDLCRRTWEAGKRVLLVPNAHAAHGAERLSGGKWWEALRKKTFWIHVQSAVKYFAKYFFKSRPKVF